MWGGTAIALRWGNIVKHIVRTWAQSAPAEPTYGSADAFLPDLVVAPVRPPARADAQSVALPPHESLCGAPAISIVLGSMNRFDLLRKAIESARAELHEVDGEIIVVDGGSTDGSAEWLLRQGDVITIIQKNRFEKGDRSFRKRSWGGFMNMGFRAAAGRHVLMISDDCLLAPGAVTAALVRIAEAEAAGLKVGACAFYFRNWPEEDRYYVQRTIGGNLMVNHGLYSKEALEAVGYADEHSYVFYKADTDLSLRIWHAGFAIIDSPGSICEHYVGVAEKLRESNNAVMYYDREQMRRLWPDLVSKSAVSKMGKAFLDTAPGPQADNAWAEIRRREQTSLEVARPK
jgi:GT2 family glycosyltransferase